MERERVGGKSVSTSIYCEEKNVEIHLSWYWKDLDEIDCSRMWILPANLHIVAAIQQIDLVR